MNAETLNNSIFPFVCARCCKTHQPGVSESDTSKEAKRSDDEGRQTTPIFWASASESICRKIVVRLSISSSERRPRLGRISNSPRIFSSSADVFCSVIAENDLGGEIETARTPVWLSRHPPRQAARHNIIRRLIPRIVQDELRQLGALGSGVRLHSHAKAHNIRRNGLSRANCQCNQATKPGSPLTSSESCSTHSQCSKLSLAVS
jgi:hypothetical protein